MIKSGENLSERTITIRYNISLYLYLYGCAFRRREDALVFFSLLNCVSLNQVKREERLNLNGCCLALSIVFTLNEVCAGLQDRQADKVNANSLYLNNHDL